VFLATGARKALSIMRVVGGSLSTIGNLKKEKSHTNTIIIDTTAQKQAADDLLNQRHTPIDIRKCRKKKMKRANKSLNHHLLLFSNLLFFLLNWFKVVI
jgi:hypothetical protein